MEKWSKIDLKKRKWSTMNHLQLISRDNSVNELFYPSKIETAWDRYRQQEPECPFGLNGTCCKRCFNGPCRIVDQKADANEHHSSGKIIHSFKTRGVCGATTDTIAMRNLVELCTSGAAQHIYHAYEVLEVFNKTINGKVKYQIKDKEKLKEILKILNLKSAKELSKLTFNDFSRHEGTFSWFKVFGNKFALNKWKSLNILPVNPFEEISKSVVRTSIGCDADPSNLLLELAAMGINDGFGLHVSTSLQDILFGTPKIVKTTAKLGVIKETHINIAVHGHMPIIAEKVLEWAKKLEPKARKLGAEGFNVVGICCSGNELMQRQGIPLAMNFAGQELPILTGALDSMVVDVQCIMPSLPSVAECFHTKIITTLPYIKIPGAVHIEYSPEKADDFAKKVIQVSMDAYTNRNPKKIFIPREKIEMYAGFSEKTILGALSKVDKKPLDYLIARIAKGDILGIVAIVGCASNKIRQDYGFTELVDYLLKNNVLILSTGCGAHAYARHGYMVPYSKHLRKCGEGLRKFLHDVGRANGLSSLPPVLHVGSCVDNSRIVNLLNAISSRLNIPINKLPVVGSCPEMQSVKVLSIGSYMLSLGIDVHVGVPFPVQSSKFTMDALCADKGKAKVTLDEIFGSKMLMEPEPLLAGKWIVKQLKKRRRLIIA